MFDENIIGGYLLNERNNSESWNIEDILNISDNNNTNIDNKIGNDVETDKEIIERDY